MTSQPHYQLSGVAEGLSHLHQCNVIHGGLKGVSDHVSRWFTVLTSGQSNILVDAAGHARVTDFGLATVTQDLDSIRKGLGEHGHSARWIAPEILSDRGAHSKEADVFSFAMVTIEVSCGRAAQLGLRTLELRFCTKVFTGSIPFGDKPPHRAIRAIVGGERPPRPANPILTDRLWGLIQRCWDQDIRRRPRALRLSCSL